MRDQKFILDGHKVVPADLMTWAKWFETAGTSRIVAKTNVGDVPDSEASISTVFLGIDHNFSDSGPPLLFETLVFGGKHADHMERYSTWDEAEKGHARIVAMHVESAPGSVMAQ